MPSPNNPPPTKEEEEVPPALSLSDQAPSLNDNDQGWRATLALSPSFYEASLRLRAVPFPPPPPPPPPPPTLATSSEQAASGPRPGGLSPKHKHLIALAVDSAATHLYAPGIRADVHAALAAGATVAEVVEVVELTSTLGIHACNVGIPLLVEVMKEEGVYETHFPSPSCVSSSKKEEESHEAQEWDPYRQRLKDEFTAKRGYWHPTWEDFLRVDPAFFEAYMAFSSVPWTKEVNGSRQGALEPKIKELVYCAFDAAATHLYVTGLKLHMRNALGYGATPQEIAEVLEIASLLSLHTAHTAFPLIAEAIKQQ